MTLKRENREAERSFSNLSTTENNWLEKRLNCLFILSTENDVTKPLSHKEAIKRHADKECRKEV
jgi:hypothetical protein